MNQLKTGAILSYINIITRIFIVFLYTPILVKLLGQDAYGLYSLIVSFAGYLSVLDMGFGNALIRYLAQNRVAGNKQREYQLNGLFLILYGIMALLTISVGIFLYFSIDELFVRTLTLQDLYSAKIMMIIMILNFAISLPLNIFASIVQAYERFIFLKIFNILQALLTPVLVVIFLYHGYGSIMVVAVTALVSIGILIANAVYCFFYLDVGFQFVFFKKQFLIEVFSYSFFMFLEMIMGRVYWGTGQFVLGMVSGTLDVAVFALAVQFVTLYMSVSSAISSVLLPKVTMMVANGAGMSELTDLMIKIGRLQCIAVGYLLAMFVLCGDTFLRLWVGTAYSDTYVIVVIFFIALFIPLVQNTGISILLAMNLNKWRMFVYTLVAAMNVLISIPLAKLYGGVGCALSTAGALFISTGIFINIYYNYLGIDILRFIRHISRLTIIIVATISIGYFFETISFVNANSWFIFAQKVFMYSSIYFVLVSYFGLNAYERTILKELCIKIRSKI